jgi:hypothetical protein
MVSLRRCGSRSGTNIGFLSNHFVEGLDELVTIGLAGRLSCAVQQIFCEVADVLV